MKKIEVVALVIFFVALFLQATLAFYSNVISSESYESTKLKADIKEFKDANLSLKTKIFQYTSLEHVSSRGAELGFVKARSYISLSSFAEDRGRKTVYECSSSASEGCSLPKEEKIPGTLVRGASFSPAQIAINQ